jgi:hypothetical protein
MVPLTGAANEFERRCGQRDVLLVRNRLIKCQCTDMRLLLRRSLSKCSLPGEQYREITRLLSQHER